MKLTVVRDVGGEATALYVNNTLYHATDDGYLIWEDIASLVGIGILEADLWKSA